MGYTVETDIEKRWVDGASHHPESEKLYKLIAELDLEFGKDYFCWKKGGDGDNGEHLMYLLDIHFEQKDENKKKPKPSLRDQIKELMKLDTGYPFVRVEVRQGGTTEDGYTADPEVDVEDVFTKEQCLLDVYDTEEERKQYLENNYYDFRSHADPYGSAKYKRKLESLLEKKIKPKYKDYADNWVVFYWLDEQEELHAYVSKGERYEYDLPY